MRHRRVLLFSTVVSWLGLVLCLGITIDRVDDLVFEETDIVEEFNLASDKAENPDEHLLLRSAHTDGSALTIVMLTPSADSATGYFSLQPVTVSARIASAYQHPPARSSPGSFITPLRI